MKDHTQVGIQDDTDFKPVILMCPPDYYKILAPDPKWGAFNEKSKEGWKIFDRDPELFRKKARAQWESLKDVLQHEIKVDVQLIKPEENLCDQVFTADATLSLNRYEKAITFESCFTHPFRQQETRAHLQLIQEHFKHRRIKKLEVPCEGAGDNLYDTFRDVYWSGYTKDKYPSAGRSSVQAHRIIEQEALIKVHSIEVKKPFFHIDTCFASLNQGHIILYKEGMSSQGYHDVIKLGLHQFDLDPNKYLYEVNEAQALSYACNVIHINEHIVLQKGHEALSQWLSEAGYRVHEVDVSCFIHGGGGPHCLVNYINHPRKQLKR